MLPESLRSVLNVAQALRPTGLQLPRSLLGEPDSWSVKTCPPTELQLLEPGNWLKAAQTLAHLAIPAVPKRLPSWVRLRPALKPTARLFLRPSKVYRYRPAILRPDPTPDQAWFFINGVGTDRNLLMLNAAYLTELFQRRLTLLHDPSRSLLPDLAECALGKGRRGVSEAARLAFAPIYVALKQPSCRRVVLLAHSRGSVVAGVLLWLLRGLYPPTASALLEGEPRCPEQRVARVLAHKWGFPCAEAVARTSAAPGSIKPPLTRQELSKLEVYAFANCASLMGPIDRQSGLPYIESYGNEHDVVARLGVLARGTDLRTPLIGGERFMRRDAWGHLLNAHYLFPMEQEYRARQRGETPPSALRPLPGNAHRHPRLFEYFGGASPPAYAAAQRPQARQVAPEPAGWIEPVRMRRAG